MIRARGFREAAKLAGIGLLAFAAALLLGGASPVKLAALLLFGLLCLATLRTPLIGLALLIIMIVANLSSNLIDGFGAPSAAKLAAPGLMALLAVRFMFWGDRPYAGWLALWLLAGLLALKLFGATYAPGWQTVLANTGDFAKDAVVAMLALGFMGYRKGVETVTVSACLTAAACCGLGLVQVLGLALPEGLGLFARFNEYTGRFSGPIADGNFFAVILVFCIPLALFQLLHARRPAALLLWSVSVCLLLFGLLATQSRGGILALVVSLVLFFPQLGPRQKMAGAAGVAAVALAAALMVGPEAMERLASLGDLSQGRVDVSTEGRLASWRVAFEIFKAEPWLGVGSGNFNLLYQDIALQEGLIFRGEGRSTHSLYLEVLTEQGLLGLMYFLFILATAAAGILAASRHARARGAPRLSRHFLAFGAGLAGYLAGMALLHDAYPRFLWIVLMIGVEAGRIVQLRLTPASPAGDPQPPLLLPRAARVQSKAAAEAPGRT